MPNFKFKDFNEAYFKLNKMILEDPEYIQYLNTTMGGIDQLKLTIKSPLCDKIDLGILGYKQQKWTHLIRTYLGEDKVQELQTLGLDIGGLSVGFDFLRKTSHNGACMREIILNRQKRKKPWDSITIVWRTTELQRRWAADLILISRIIELIPNTDFKTINLYMVSAYQSAMYIIPFVEKVFGVRIEDLDPDHFYTKVIITREEKYYKPEKSPHSLLASGDRLVQIYKDIKKGKKFPRLGYEHCILKEV
jgi:hypothetical protein